MAVSKASNTDLKETYHMMRAGHVRMYALKGRRCSIDKICGRLKVNRLSGASKSARGDMMLWGICVQPENKENANVQN